MSVVLGQVGQIRHGAHPVAFAQQGPPRQRHPGHLQHVLVLLDLLQAVGADAAARQGLLPPVRRRRAGAPTLRGECFEPLPSLPIHLQEPLDLEARLPPVSQDEGDLGTHGDPGRGELVCVGRQLQQRGDLGVASELGVVHGVGAVRPADQEVRAAVEAAVVEGGLEDDVGPGAQGRHGLLVLGGEGLVGHRSRRLHLVHPAPGRARVRWLVGAVPLPQLGQHLGLVAVPEPRGALEHRVLGHRQPRHPPELLIQDPHRRPRAFRGAHQIGGGVDEDAAVGLDAAGDVDEEHLRPPGGVSGGGCRRLAPPYEGRLTDRTADGKPDGCKKVSEIGAAAAVEVRAPLRHWSLTEPRSVRDASSRGENRTKECCR
ncbi:Uncharacterised protein [Mycobacteroides abscessus subsp. abscessus]|nr:Uncharacterised protein [Mycobacteroides abscessus subsp. abscessus]